MASIRVLTGSFLGALLSSCTVDPGAQPEVAPAHAGTRPATPADAPPPAEAPSVAAPSWPMPAEVLTPWDLALLVMDTHELTAEQRRQRAYARRKRIMLNPDSSAANVLDDLAKAAAAGEIDPNGSSSVVFTANGGVQGGAPPAGWRPPAGTDPAPPAGEAAPK